MKKLNRREVKDTAKARGRDESLAQSLDLSCIMSQTWWEMQCGDNFIWHRNHSYMVSLVLYLYRPGYDYVHSLARCTSFQTPITFCWWDLWGQTVFDQFEGNFYQRKKIVACNLGWYTTLLLSIRAVFDLVPIYFPLLFPENYRILFAFPLKHFAVWCLWAFSCASHSIWHTHSSPYLPFPFFKFAFSEVHSHFGVLSALFWISLPYASFFHCPYHTVLWIYLSVFSTRLWAFWSS